MTRKEEIATKVQRVRALIGSMDLKAVLLKSQSSFCWITAGGLNVVTIADLAGVASILVTAKDCFFIT
jgi:Xaa-Pro dipeptidase